MWFRFCPMVMFRFILVLASWFRAVLGLGLTYRLGWVFLILVLGYFYGLVLGLGYGLQLQLWFRLHFGV